MRNTNKRDYPNWKFTKKNKTKPPKELTPNQDRWTIIIAITEHVIVSY